MSLRNMMAKEKFMNARYIINVSRNLRLPEKFYSLLSADWPK